VGVAHCNARASRATIPLPRCPNPPRAISSTSPSTPLTSPAGIPSRTSTPRFPSKPKPIKPPSKGEEILDKPGDDRFTWLIDPIDGTKSFIHGVPLYGTLVACLIEQVPRVGVIYLPALNDLIAAADGEGCFWNGRRARCSDVTRIENATVLAGSITRTIDRSGAFRDLADRARLNRGWGDAFGYALVATGRAEVMLDPKVSPWDCAAMPPIFREAGGWAGNWNGNQDIHGRDWLACCAGLKQEVLATLARHGHQPA
jgi:fructose-1,6-bisphosphatase/inositol monophosphatase family enzyme